MLNLHSCCMGKRKFVKSMIDEPRENLTYFEGWHLSKGYVCLFSGTLSRFKFTQSSVFIYNENSYYIKMKMQ